MIASPRFTLIVQASLSGSETSGKLKSMKQFTGALIPEIVEVKVGGPEFDNEEAIIYSDCETQLRDTEYISEYIDPPKPLMNTLT